MRKLDYGSILDLYRNGRFPMADSADTPDIAIVEPELRGIIPIGGLHMSRSLKKFIKRSDLTVTLDLDFDGVVKACAKPRPTEGGGTWISEPLKQVYRAFADNGHAHSVEVWSEDNRLVGGLFGVCIGGAFFGESMFSAVPNASKLALVYLVSRLSQSGYVLLDTQYLTPHLKSMGGIEIPQSEYLKLLAPAIELQAKPLLPE